MKCSVCGHINDADSKFCIKCGKKIVVTNEGQGIDSMELNTGVDDNAGSKAISNPVNSENENMNKFKEFVSDFWKYYVDLILRPTSMVNSLNQKQLTNGLIMIVLFSLLLPLQTYFAFSGSSFSFIKPSFTETVVQPFFYLLLFVVGMAGLIYATMKIAKTDGDFTTVLARFGGLLAIPVSFQIIALILLKISPSIAMMFNLLGFMGLLLAILYTFQSFVKGKEIKGDLLHYVYGILVVLFIFLALLGKTFIENQMGSLFYMF